MYCVSCYIRDGKGTVPATYLFNGRSLCNLCFWSEVDGKSLPAVVGDNLPATTGKKQRGTRMPKDFMPATETVEQMLAEFPTVTKAEWTREHLKFKDYWNGISTQRGVKLDWEGTWRNWMRKAFERRHPAEVSGAPSKVDGKAASYLED